MIVAHPSNKPSDQLGTRATNRKLLTLAIDSSPGRPEATRDLAIAGGDAVAAVVAAAETTIAGPGIKNHGDPIVRNRKHEHPRNKTSGRSRKTSSHSRIVASAEQKLTRTALGTRINRAADGGGDGEAGNVIVLIEMEQAIARLLQGRRMKCQPTKIWM